VSSFELLFKRNTLVNREQYVIPTFFGKAQQGAVFLTGKTGLAHTLAAMSGC